MPSSADGPIGYVGHVKDGMYSACVDYEPETPFGCVIGPSDVTLDQALEWARRHAQVVRVRTEEATYTAGEGEPLPRPDARSGPVRRWEVEGHVSSRADGLADVARRFAQAVERDERTSDTRHWLAEWGLAVAFTIRCPAAEQYEVGSRVLRDSWAAADIPGDRIEPSYSSSVHVRPVE